LLPAICRHVIFKLLGFTFAMITLPIGTYFMTVNTIFKGNSTFAGGLAAVMANVVLIGYVIVAMKEDQSDRLEAEKEAKKAR
ncbi:Vacuolar ATPase assembly integral membrane protein VMA21, partial [Diplodia seriata]